MDHSRAAYAASKERNEETLLRIQRLGHEIKKTEQEIRDKRKRSQCLRLYHNQVDRRTQRQHAYHSIMFTSSDQPLSWMNGDSDNDRQQQSNQYLRSSSSNEKKLESFQAVYQQILKHEQEPPDARDIFELLASTLSKKSASSSSSSTPFFDLVKEIVNKIEPPSDKIASSSPSLRQRKSIDEDTEGRIKNDLTQRKHETQRVRKECDVLEARVGQLEQDLRTRIRKLYRDLNVQTTLLKRIRTEAESQSAAAQRKATQEQANALQAKVMDAHISCTASNNQVNIESTVNAVGEKQRQIAHMMGLVRIGALQLKEQREKCDNEENERRKTLLEQLDGNCKELKNSIRRKIDLFHQLPLFNGSNDAIATQGDSTRLEQIKDCFHPYLRPSRQGVVDQLGEVLIRVNALAVTEPPESELRETLENLAARWQQDLEESNVDIGEHKPREDAVDALIKSVAALKST
ncbi:hypothetical protein BDB00DRAFT_312518 [Zychaea mexicana]|uniref:uncharacterized protein n=1 Tax=Zychaea mexicana TaxID=64656 RepID=UPI0022FE7B87|nr:uncharacterized protein BDB00DRAFT_312518 [Zychaea mexicana]KAI9494346.1 hypothetical protein BDB00DRAFT_312518 [Zychaea mexicana]